MRILEFSRTHVLTGQVVSECGVKFSFRAEFGFLNDKAPFEFGRAPVYVCLLSEISDGRKAHFCRIRLVVIAMWRERW